MYLVIFILPDLCYSIKGFSRCRGYWSILLSICRVYIYTSCSAGYVELPIVLLYLLRCLVYHMLSKTRSNSRSLHRVIAYIYVRLVMPSYLFCFQYRTFDISNHRVFDIAKYRTFSIYRTLDIYRSGTAPGVQRSHTYQQIATARAAIRFWTSHRKSQHTSMYIQQATAVLRLHPLFFFGS